MALWPQLRRRPLLLGISVLTVVSLGLFMRRRTSSDTTPLKAGLQHEISKHWSSFADVSALFVFGDSWSSLGIKLCEQYEATEAYHFGNPDFPGVTTTNGPNWVGYLTHVFNRSVINTYNLAIAGSTVDSTIVRGWDGLDLKKALNRLIDPVHHCQFVPRTWNPVTSLFAIFFGMNDITACIELFQCDIYNPPITEIFKSYTKSMEALYTAGARNFLVLNAPPIDSLSAMDLPSGNNLTKAHTRASKLFNEHHQQLAQHLRTSFKDTTVFEFDVWTLFQQVYHSPQDVPETAIYRNLTGICPTYGPFKWSGGEELTQAEIDLCGGLRPEEYLWNSPSHVTWPVHKAIARGVADVMNAHEKSTTHKIKI